MKFLTKMMMNQRRRAYDFNKENILNSFSPNREALFLDLGCDDGQWTKRLAQRIETENIFGVEIVTKRAEEAKGLGVQVVSSDLNEVFPYDDQFFDVVHSNQVIEHVKDTDRFVSELFRILKPGGYGVVSTENLSSWHNIGALVLGYMPFSLVNVTSKTAALGNPFAPHNNEAFWESDSWQHVRVFTTKGLSHLFQLHGFGVEEIRGAGYYPFGNHLSRFFPSHSAFITFKVRKPA